MIRFQMRFVSYLLFHLVGAGILIWGESAWAALLCSSFNGKAIVSNIPCCGDASQRPNCGSNQPAVNTGKPCDIDPTIKGILWECQKIPPAPPPPQGQAPVPISPPPPAPPNPNSRAVVIHNHITIPSATSPANSSTTQQNANNNSNNNPPTPTPTVTYTPLNRPMWNHNKFSPDPCPTSTITDPNYNCNPTIQVIDGAKITNAVTQVGGMASTQALGASAMMNAYKPGANSQVAALEASANMQTTTGQLNLGLGGMNALLGAMQIQRSVKHNRQGDNFNSQAGAGLQVNKEGGMTSSQATEGDIGYVSAQNKNSISGKILDKFELNQEANFQFVTSQGPNDLAATKAARQKQADDALREIQREAMNLGNIASGEQKRVSSEALAGGMMSMVTGAQQMISGGMSVAAGNQLKQAAERMRHATSQQMPIVMPPGMVNPTGNLQARPATTITGSGNNPDPNATSSAVEPEEVALPPGLGTGFNPSPLPTEVGGLGPMAGKFNPGGGQGSGQGGGGGISTAGNTSPASASNEDNQPKAAPNGNGPGYDSNGNMQVGGGGGKGADGGPDLSGLLAQFLPKKEDENRPQHGILDYSGKNGETPFSVLDKNVNLFERIHKTYQDKHRQGLVGLAGG